MAPPDPVTPASKVDVAARTQSFEKQPPVADPRRAREWGAIAAVGIVGAIVCLVTTRHGIGTSPDSGAYLGAAHNILDGRGVTTPFTLNGSEYGPLRAAAFGNSVPLTQFPPLFPLAVAGLASLGISVTEAARVLNLALFGVNLTLVGLLTLRVVRSRVIAVAVMLLVLGEPGLAEIGLNQSWLLLHSFALSEPLFITWALLALLMLPRYLASGRLYDLVGASAFAGLALLTRYVGISVVIAAVIVITLWGSGRRLARSRASGVFLAISLLPSVGWALYNSLVQHGSSARSLHTHIQSIGDSLNTMEGWFTPTDWPPVAQHGVLLAAVLTVAAALVPQRTGHDRLPEQWRQSARLLLIFSVVYMAVVILTRDFLDASTPVDARLFAPIQAVCYILIVGALWALLATRSNDQASAMAMAAAVSVAVCFVVALPALNTTGKRVDQGVASKPLASLTLRGVRHLPRGILIATNAPAQLFLSTGRGSIIVPSRTNPITDQKNKRFAAQLTELVYLVTSRQGVIVLAGTNDVGFGMLGFANANDFATFPSLRVLDSSARGGTVIGTWQRDLYPR